MIEYFGIFIVDEKEIEKISDNEKVRLEKRSTNFHCTFRYKPEDMSVFNEVIGEEAELTLTGYACDGENSGYKVKLDEVIEKYFLNTDDSGKLQVPHITTSLSKDGKAVNTMNLEFENFEQPIVVRGRFGVFVKNGDERYISFEKVK